MYCNRNEDKQDLVQEVILQLWKSFPKYDETFKLSTWIYRVTLNVAISSYRKHATQRKYFQSIDEKVLTIRMSGNEDLQEQTDLLRRMVKQLTEFDRAIIILYLEEKSYEEIAEILNLSKSAVGVRIHRIKRQLKDKFKILYDET